MASQLMNPAKLSKLCAISFAKMKTFQKARLKLLKYYTGRFYGKEGAEGEAFPIMMIHQAVTTIVPNIVFSNPRAQISTKFVAYKDYSLVAGMAMDHAVEEINLRETMRKIVTDAVFMAGFAKIGLAVSGATLDIDGFMHDVGQVYCDRVGSGDMILDPAATHWEEQRFIGNRFRIDEQEFLESGLYPEGTAFEIASRYGQGTAEDASLLSGAKSMSDADDVIKGIDLVELWVPSENKIVTMPWAAGDEVIAKFIRESDYAGPSSGPYRMLGFAEVPDNILPVAPASVWHDLFIMVNMVARKAAEQAERQKSVLAYESGAWQDAQGLVDAADGESVRVDNIDAIKEITFGGTTQDAYQYIEWAKGVFSEMAMNIDMLSGGATNEPTATQAEIVNMNSSVRLADMQSMVYNFTGDCMKHIFFYLHTDPLIELPLIRRVKGIDQQVIYTPEMRKGEWLDYNIKVAPRSMARQEPNLKIRRLMEFFGSIIPAVANAFQMLGPAFNIENVLAIVGREMDIDELGEIINSEILAKQIETMKASLEAGVPIDPKAMKSMLTGLTAGSGQGMSDAAGMGGYRPQQPNPAGAVPAGMETGMEQNMARQDTAAELQPAGL